MVITIDGPAGAGKSTVADKIAEKLNILHLDTGALYRAVALYALRRGCDPTDEKAADRVIKEASVSAEYVGGAQRTFLNGEDVSSEIRLNHLSKAASDISAHKSVRLAMAALQRGIATSRDTVLDGRDAGTFVAPDADFKFYITADADERARRRVADLGARGQSADFDSVLRDMRERDKNDSNRAVAPLRKSADMTEIDTTRMSVDEVVDSVLSAVKGGRPRPRKKGRPS